MKDLCLQASQTGLKFPKFAIIRLRLMAVLQQVTNGKEDSVRFSFAGGGGHGCCDFDIPFHVALAQCLLLQQGAVN